jgi:hypothetical protein
MEVGGAEIWESRLIFCGIEAGVTTRRVRRGGLISDDKPLTGRFTIAVAGDGVVDGFFTCVAGLLVMSGFDSVVLLGIDGFVCVLFIPSTWCTVEAGGVESGSRLVAGGIVVGVIGRRFNRDVFVKEDRLLPERFRVVAGDGDLVGVSSICAVAGLLVVCGIVVGVIARRFERGGFVKENRLLPGRFRVVAGDGDLVGVSLICVVADLLVVRGFGLLILVGVFAACALPNCN